MKKEKTTKAVKEEKKILEGEYFYAVGKRKASVAQTRIYFNEKGKAAILINDRDLNDYFGLARVRDVAKAPLASIGKEGEFDVRVKVAGGGTKGQAEAIRLGIARALIKYDSAYRKALKDLGYLTRDARVVERKKPGLKKARRAPQWAKR